MNIELDNGKYTYCVNDDGTDAHALRYGEKWKDLEGDNFVYAMALEIDAQEKRIAELKSALKEITPMLPPKDAPCHYGTVAQEKCGHCSRIINAINVLKGGE